MNGSCVFFLQKEQSKLKFRWNKSPETKWGNESATFVCCIINLLSSCAQFFTFVFQSQVCFSISKASPDGQRSASNPWTEHLTTSRQSSSAVNRKYSDGGRPLQSSASFSLCVTCSACRLTTDTDKPVNRMNYVSFGNFFFISFSKNN